MRQNGGRPSKLNPNRSAPRNPHYIRNLSHPSHPHEALTLPIISPVLLIVGVIIVAALKLMPLNRVDHPAYATPPAGKRDTSTERISSKNR